MKKKESGIEQPIENSTQDKMEIESKPECVLSINTEDLITNNKIMTLLEPGIGKEALARKKAQSQRQGQVPQETKSPINPLEVKAACFKTPPLKETREARDVIRQDAAQHLRRGHGGYASFTYHMERSKRIEQARRQAKQAKTPSLG